MSSYANLDLTQDDDSNCSAPISQHHYMTFLTMVSSCFAMAGSALIIVTFILWKDIRTVARAIVVFLSIADFFTAAGYLFGAIVNYLHQHEELGHKEYQYLCRAQSFITTTFPISSFLWTSHLAIYLFVAIVIANPTLAKKLVIVFHITGWGIPLAICLPSLITGHLGGSNDQASVNWCFIHFNGTADNYWRKRLEEYYGFEFLCGKFWEITTFIVAVFLYVSVKIVLRRRTVSVLHHSSQFSIPHSTFFILSFHHSFFPPSQQNPSNQGTLK